MKHKYIVLTMGYYGCGSTLHEAATNCRKAGSRVSEPALAYRYDHEDAKRLEEVSVDNQGCVNYPQDVVSTQLTSIRKGNNLPCVKLSNLIHS